MNALLVPALRQQVPPQIGLVRSAANSLYRTFISILTELRISPTSSPNGLVVLQSRKWQHTEASLNCNGYKSMEGPIFYRYQTCNISLLTSLSQLPPPPLPQAIVALSATKNKQLEYAVPPGQKKGRNGNLRMATLPNGNVSTYKDGCWPCSLCPLHGEQNHITNRHNQSRRLTVLGRQYHN